MNYANKIRDEMAPLVLGRIAESINEKDYDQMNRLMTPYLAKLYKNAVDDLDAQGFHMKLKIDVEGSDAINDFEWLQQGHPEGHDYTIPYSVRNAKYGIGKSVKLKVAIKRNKDGKPVSSGLNREFGGGVFATWLAFEYGFVVKTNVKVELYKHNRIVDSDSGMMQIPVAVSSPHYFGMQAMMDAVSGGENVQSEEPFRWKVCDLFYIADRNNADSIAKENENNNE
ncbi:hypothetical protein IW140_005773 [Coemansia sp. RSA 1813]|nr:hypothetical protein EV178_005333 [Coemansia sp. RSA 1646]KAJ2086943.1 hypothetical protein IW138_005290 [Coemansia sp. RSA 986]KAJ2211755.1 hypothetical protein EV179_005192 [Coemansia sp. RSA 487]KAJ2564335.1 hypothetical protein IW140_005773 [Coemansia sp. RSA 1813]